MTLITRIIDESYTIIASDNQVNDLTGNPWYISKDQIATTTKLIMKSSFIAGLSGLLHTKDFDLKNIIHNSNNANEIVSNLNTSIPENVKNEKIIILITELIENRIYNNAIVGFKNNFDILEKQQTDNLFDSWFAWAIIDNKDEYDNICKSFDQESYLRYIDFNFNYVVDTEDKVIEKHPCLFYTLFHIDLYNRFGHDSISSFMALDDTNKTDIIIKFYEKISKLKYSSKYIISNKSHFKTIGECNQIYKLDKSGIKILFENGFTHIL